MENKPLSQTVRLIRKANDLVEARYKFNIWEMRIFTKMLTMIHRDDEDFYEYKIYLQDIIEDFGLQKDNASYEWLKDGARRLMTKIIKIVRQTADGQMEFETPIIAGLDSFSETHGKYILVSFHPKMKPYLLQLKSQFLMYDVRNILSLPSVYSIRIYELLKQYEKIGRRKIKISELKDILGIPDKYKLYGHFKKRVIQKAQTDLEEHTDISFTFDEIKRGRAVIELVFYIKKNVPERQPEQFLEEDSATTSALLQELYPQVEEWVSKDTFKKWVEAFPEAQVRRGIRYTLNQLEEGNEIENKGGYLLSMIRQTELFDPIEDKKTKAASAKQNAKEKMLQKQQLEEQERQLRKEYHQKEQAIIQDLLSKDANLRTATAEAAKASRFVQYDDAKSEAENYQENVMFRVAVHNKVKELYQDKFSRLQEQYEPKIESVKQVLRQL